MTAVLESLVIDIESDHNTAKPRGASPRCT
jgi:hypothetical protein